MNEKKTNKTKRNLTIKIGKNRRGKRIRCEGLRACDGEKFLQTGQKFSQFCSAWILRRFIVTDAWDKSSSVLPKLSTKEAIALGGCFPNLKIKLGFERGGVWVCV